MLINATVIDKVKLNLIYLYFLFSSLYAPITYYFSEFRFIFSGIALSFAILGFFYLKNKYNIIFLFIFFIYLSISVLNNGLQQSFYGVYIYSFFLFSFTIKKENIVSFLKNKSVFWILILFINIFSVLYVDKNGSPWIGVSIENFGLERRLSKDWTADSVIRNPGFSSTSVNVACLLLLSYFMSIFTTYYKYKRVTFIFSIILYPLVMYSIYLTTTKTIMLSMLVISLFFLIPKYIIPLVSKSMVVLMFFLSYFFFFMPKQEYYGNNTLLIRFYDMWPSAFEILEGYLAKIIGKGFGSIGTAQSFKNQYLITNPGDNILVYLYVCFGITSTLFCIYFLLKFIFNKQNIPNTNSRYFFVIFMILIFNSFSYNMVELSVLAIIYGMFIKNAMFRHSLSK